MSPMPRFLLLLLCLATAASLRAEAPADRYELGQRLRAFEIAWDEQADAKARQRATAPLKEATRAFFAFRFREVDRQLDEARFALRDKVTPESRWAASLSARPESRLIDASRKELAVTVARLYEVDARQPDKPMLRLALLDMGGKALAPPTEMVMAELPAKARLPLQMPTEGDYLLRAEIVAGKDVLARWDQTVAIVKDLQARLEALTKATKALPENPPTTDAATVRGLLRVLQPLAEGQTLETNYPAARLLADAEAAIKDIVAGRPYFGQKRTGQFWLTLSTGKRTESIRLLAPKAAAKGEPLPLVVALHGAGGSENMFFDGYGNGAIARLCEQRGWLLVTPRTEGFVRAPVLPEIIDEVARLYPTDRKRVFLVGHSMGAMQSVGFVQAAPERYAGMAALGGGVALRNPPAGIKEVPFFLGVGTDDFALKGVVTMKESLAKAEVKKVLYKEYPGIEHLTVVQVALPEVFAFFDDVSGKK